MPRFSRNMLFSLLMSMGLLTSGIVATSAQVQGTVDVRIWTVTANQTPVYDVCYELAGYSNVGCDENLDGNVLFEDIPFGDYEVVPVYQNGATNRVDPFRISVHAVSTDFVVQVVDSPAVPPDVTDVLLLTRDPKTGESLTDVCYELVGYSNIGCDENKDGRVSFDDIPYSSLYTIRQTTTPAGYPAMDDVYVSIMPMDVNGPRTILLSQSKEQASAGHLNVSVVFYETGTNTLLMDPENCVQLRYNGQSASNIGCDEDIVDGQIDFMDVDIDPNAASFALRANTMCGYDIVQNPQLQRLWVSEQYLMLYIELAPNDEVCR